MKSPLFFVWAFFSVFNFLPVIYGLKIFQTLNKELRIFYWYLMAGLIDWLVGLFFALQSRNTLWLNNLFLPIELGFVLWLFAMWQTRLKIKYVLQFTFLGFVVVFITELIIARNLFDYTLISGPLESVILIVASFLTIHDANKDYDTMLTDQPRFWISTGILLASSGVIVVQVLSHMLLQYHRDLFQYAIFVSPLSNTLAQFLFFGGLRCHYKLQKSGG